MLNERSIRAVSGSRIDDSLAVPLYGSYCFAGIPGAVETALADAAPTLPSDVLPEPGRRYRAVVLLLIDGFGWRLFERSTSLPFFRRFLDAGVASKLTSQFPSTTSAHVSTIHTGQPVGRTGMFEWWYYEPLLDRLFAPLPALTSEGDAHVPLASRPAGLFPEQTRYRDLAARGIASTCLISQEYADSPFSLAMTQGARVASFTDLTDALAQLAEGLAQPGPSYHLLYVDAVDRLAHRRGPGAPEVDAAVRAIGRALERWLPALPDDALLMLTADHGQTAVDPARLIRLDALSPQLARYMRRDGAGRPLAPAGSPRDLFLYLRPETIDQAVATLSRALDGRARVYRTEDLIAMGVFGPEVGPRLRARIGGAVILPAPGEMVWWGRGVDKRGHHGGLTADELEIPLLTLG